MITFNLQQALKAGLKVHKGYIEVPNGNGQLLNSHQYRESIDCSTTVSGRAFEPLTQWLTQHKIHWKLS